MDTRETLIYLARTADIAERHEGKAVDYVNLALVLMAI
jgi:hypothetical protein